MKGRVKYMNPRRGMIAIEIDSGDLTVFEALGTYPIDIGDTISGDLESHGGQTFKNLTKNISMEVSVEGIHCDFKYAMSLLR